MQLSNLIRETERLVVKAEQEAKNAAQRLVRLKNDLVALKRTHYIEKHGPGAEPKAERNGRLSAPAAAKIVLKGHGGSMHGKSLHGAITEMGVTVSQRSFYATLWKYANDGRYFEAKGGNTWDLLDR